MRRSFTVVEVAVVALILIIIFAVAIPRFRNMTPKPEPTAAGEAPSKVVRDSEVFLSPEQTRELSPDVVVGRLYFLNENMTERAVKSEGEVNGKISYAEFGPEYELYEGDAVEAVTFVREDEVLCRYWGSIEQRKGPGPRMPYGTEFITRIDDLEPSRPKENLTKGEPGTV